MPAYTPEQERLLRQFGPRAMNLPEFTAAGPTVLPTPDLSGAVPSQSPAGTSPLALPGQEGTQAAAEGALLAGARAAANVGNTAQVQGGQQQGVFSTTGQTSQQGAQVGSQDTSQQGVTQQFGGTQGQSATTGSTASSGSEFSQGTTTGATGVTDTLGLGALLQQGVPGAQQADASRGAFLSDLVDTGGQQFQGQVKEAVNQSLSGPGMQGVGQSGQARAASYAANRVAQENLGARLAASGQMAGPTATQNLVSAGNPYLGQTNTQTAQNFGQQAQSGVQNQATNTNQQSQQTGLSNQRTSTDTAQLSSMLSNEAQSGSSAASNMQIAAGQTPQQSTSSGGGCYVSSIMAAQGLIGHRCIREAVKFKLYERNDKFMPIGYSLYGPALALYVQRSPRFARAFAHVVRAILYHELALAGRAPRRWKASLWHGAWECASAALGWLAAPFGATFGTSNAKVLAVLKTENLYFER